MCVVNSTWTWLACNLRERFFQDHMTFVIWVVNDNPWFLSLCLYFPKIFDRVGADTKWKGRPWFLLVVGENLWKPALHLVAYFLQEYFISDEVGKCMARIERPKNPDESAICDRKTVGYMVYCLHGFPRHAWSIFAKQFSVECGNEVLWDRLYSLLVLGSP